MFSKLLALFILVPLAELLIFVQLGQHIGLGATIWIIILTAILGAALARAQGRQALTRFQQALSSGTLPHQEALDGIMILLASAVLLTPGFLTDTVGFALLLPPVRAVVRHRFADRLRDKIKIRPAGSATFPGSSSPHQERPAQRRASSLDDGQVIDV